MKGKGKSSATQEKDYVPQLVRQAVAVLRRHGVQQELMQQTEEEMVSMTGELVDERRARRQEQHANEQLRKKLEATEQEKQDAKQGKKDAEVARRQEHYLGRENARQVKDHEAERVRWEEERQRGAARTANVQQQLSADAESERQRRKQLEAIVAAKDCEARAQQANSRRIERELREEREKNGVLSSLPHRSVAMVTAEAVVVQKEAAERLDQVYANKTKKIAMNMWRKKKGRRAKPEDVEYCISWITEHYLIDIPGRTKKVKTKVCVEGKWVVQKVEMTVCGLRDTYDNIFRAFKKNRERAGNRE